MGTGRRLVERVTSDAPGPAAYLTDKDFKPASPRAVFNRAAKHSLPSTGDIPGPGKYPVKSCLGEGPRAVLLSRQAPVSLDGDKPGPGNYDPKLPRDPRAYSFGVKTELLTRSKMNSPGPGAYSPGPSETSPRAV